MEVGVTFLKMLQAIIRRPSEITENPPLLVLLHGLGADEHDLMGLAAELSPKLLVVSIRAPIEYGNGGYAWFNIHWDAEGVHVDEDQVLASRDILIETLTLLPEAIGIQPSTFLLGGFSQGAMMSLSVALGKPELIDGAILMSGRLLPEFTPFEPFEATKRLPFLVQHGASDQVLPVEGSRAIRDYLIGLGCDVTYREYPMAHEISQRSLADVRNWIDERLR